MFDPDLIEQMDDDSQARLALACNTFLLSKLIDKQIRREQDRLLVGSADDSDSSLLNQIREYRKRLHVLITLQQFCESMKELLP